MPHLFALKYQSYLFMTLVMAMAIFVLASSPAHADYFVWEDEKTGVSASFPDQWKLTHNQKPGDIFTVVAPQDYKDAPRCRLQVTDDGRYLIFPRDLSWAVQKQAYSTAFMKEAAAKLYVDPKIIQFGDHAGLGNGFGSYVLVDYRGEDGVEKRALNITVSYADKAYVYECTAAKHGFDKWRFLFQSIADSIEFPELYATKPNGHYRDFIANP